MFGDLTQSFASMIEDFPLRKDFGLSVLITNDSDGKAIVNTGVPFCAVCLSKSRNPMTFIGGGIYDPMIMSIMVGVELYNFSNSDDNGLQAKMDNMVYDLFRYVERCVSDPRNKHFVKARKEFGFSATYNGFNTGVTVAFEKNTGDKGPALKVYTCQYICNVTDSVHISGGRGIELELKKIDLKLKDFNVPTGAETGFTQTTHLPHG